MPHPPVEVAEGIHCIDTGFLGREGLAASYLLLRGGRAAFVETGTTHAVPCLLAALEALGLGRDRVDYVIVTHVHLDHAGGAGALMTHLPAARLVVHPRGARHLIDPARLVAGATAVYGEAAMARDYGEVVAVPAERVVEAGDGFQLTLGGATLRFLDTPGHARHHFCVLDEATGGLFAGDTGGMSLRALDGPRGPFVYLPSAPVQFDPEAWHATLERLAALGPRMLLLTHFGRIDAVGRAFATLHAEIDRYVAIARACPHAGDAAQAWLEARLREAMAERLAAEEVPLPAEEALALLAHDITVNAQGLAVWRAQAG
ncbi:MBL fold metallo-hydrolase [Inmirania thermothiophila]|uniref:Metallo-beta-lactamase superfamily protein n=1 Tax=Inmirania thermothiophila TaxID=1750597 RepID=A0A3N1YA80_9GAMM|nr:MBL fold metallo-hydrolase [Inmirania thermothiophila]ROR34532.1 metallo-beta-lactamase superfamily protein [Inmirania thermothiophila]